METTPFNNAESPDFIVLNSLLEQYGTNILTGTLNLANKGDERCIIMRDPSKSKISVVTKEPKIDKGIDEIRSLLKFFTPEDPRDF